MGGNSDLSTKTVVDIIRSRRTIHNYQPESVPVSVIESAIESARWAPNHRLTEPWQFYLIGPVAAFQIIELNTDLVREERGEGAAAEKFKRWSTMPGWMAVTARRSTDAHRQREDYAATCCAIENFMLHLWAHGVGSKWGTGPVIRHPEFFRIVGIDTATEDVVGLFWYGYPEGEIPSGVRKRTQGDLTSKLA